MQAIDKRKNKLVNRFSYLFAANTVIGNQIVKNTVLDKLG